MYPMASKSQEISNRLVIIETYVKVPPTTDYARGYLACLMDEAAEDMDDAGSDIFEQALKIVDDIHRSQLVRRRALTLR